MGLIDFILNVVGLLLWLNWCAARHDPLAHATARTLLGTLKPTAPVQRRRWPLLLGLGSLLGARAVFYWELGPALNWDPALNLGAVVIPFRPGLAGQALLYSLLSFLRMFVVLYLWLIFLWIAAPVEARGNPAAKLIRVHLGRIATLPYPVQLMLPFLATAALWAAFEPLLASVGAASPARSALQLLARTTVIGLSGYVTLRWLIVFLLLAYFVDSYVYVGRRPALEFTVCIAGRLLRPLRKVPLRVGKLDFAPCVGLALVLMAGEALLWLLPKLYWL
ncbi:MAG: hypothetical protein NZ739_04280 [Verrucomicrobiae bacterium]|nr:hypothetical protein [Verrucomicrobiae bacterium]